MLVKKAKALHEAFRVSMCIGELIKLINFVYLKGDHDHMYKEAYLKSIEEPEQFWGEVAKLISWDKNFEQVLDNSSE